MNAFIAVVRILKWEIIKRYYNLRYILIGYAALLLLLVVLPAQIGKVHPVFDVILFVFGLLIMLAAFFLIVIYPTNAIITGLRDQHTPLERSRPVPFALSMAAQLLTNATVILLIYGLSVAASEHSSTQPPIRRMMNPNTKSQIKYSLIIVPMVAI